MAKIEQYLIQTYCPLHLTLAGLESDVMLPGKAAEGEG